MKHPKHFATILLTWYDQYGRKDLPWRQSITPYRVWVSEIMLQQTQVKTVIPYFKQFMQCFPSIKHLANAHEDEVLKLWTGLGYYARARNLHRTAKILAANYQNEFPQNLAEIENLPGIGRSTAGAILAIGFNKKAAILDGNVKRVLTRLHAISGWPGDNKVAKQLWELAENYTPTIRVNDYTQAIMDLGAMICTRTQPQCQHCPIQHYCLAYQHKEVKLFPTPKPNKILPVRSTQMLIIQNNNGEILLEKRPPTGIWGSLWSFPECLNHCDIENWCQIQLQCRIKKLTIKPTFRHTFSHFHLDITPIHIEIIPKANRISDQSNLYWYNPAKPLQGGMATPVKQLINELGQNYINRKIKQN